MSGIFGLVKFNNEPVLEEELIQMQDAMTNVHSAANTLKCTGSAGFGHMQINSSPEAKYEKLPSEDPGGKFLFTAYARLDYRDELGSKLGISKAEMFITPDSELVFKAFLKWDKSCVNHILGDWIFAVYNKRKKELFLAKDHLGNTGIYYSKHKDYFCFSTSVKGILSFNWLNKILDENTIIALLTAGRRHRTHQTVYKNIFNLKATHYISVTKNKNPEQIQYWNIRDIVPVRYKREEEYIEHFLSIYHDAINSRIRTPGEVGILLSSGLDSSSVAAIAAPKLKEQKKVLYSYTSVPLYKDQIPEKFPFQADESEYVQKIADYTGNIETSFVNAKDYSPVRSLIGRIEGMGHMVNISYNSYWIQNIVDLASQKNIKRMLTGQNGNHTISWDGSYYILKMLLEGKLKRSYCEIIDWRNKNNIRTYDAIKRLIALPLKDRLSAYLNRSIKKRNYSLFKNAAIKDSIIDSINISEIFKNLDYVPNYTIENNPERLRQRLFASQISELGLMYNELRLANGVEFIDPTQDKRIVEFTFGLPYSLWISKGTNRYLIRKAMEGKIPKEILDNRFRVPQAADIGIRLAKAPELRSLVALAKKNQNFAKYVDHAKLSYHVDELNSEKSVLRKKLNAQYVLYAIGISWFLSEF